MALQDVRSFLKDEHADDMIWSLVWLMLFIAIGRFAVDVTNVIRAGIGDERPEGRKASCLPRRNWSGDGKNSSSTGRAERPAADTESPATAVADHGQPGPGHQGRGNSYPIFATTMFAGFLHALVQLRDPRFRHVLIRSVAYSAVLVVIFGACAGWLVTSLPDALALPLIGKITLPLVGEVTVPVVGEVAMPLRQVEEITFPLVIMVSSVLMFPVAGMVLNLLLDDIVDTVEARNYPHMPVLRPSGRVEAVGGGVMFALLVFTVNAGALIFYVVAGALAPLVFWAVNGFLLGNEFFTLIAGRRLPRDEVATLRRIQGWRIWFAGCLMALPLSLPVIGFVVPVLGAAVHTHMFHRARRFAPSARREAESTREPGPSAGAVAGALTMGGMVGRLLRMKVAKAA